eukprot:5797985-Prymnesium_polylepis.2
MLLSLYLPSCLLVCLSHRCRLLLQQPRRGKIAIAADAQEGPAPPPNNARRGSILKVTDDAAAITQPRELLKARLRATCCSSSFHHEHLLYSVAARISCHSHVLSIFVLMAHITTMFASQMGSREMTSGGRRTSTIGARRDSVGGRRNSIAGRRNSCTTGGAGGDSVAAGAQPAALQARTQ